MNQKKDEHEPDMDEVVLTDGTTLGHFLQLRQAVATNRIKAASDALAAGADRVEREGDVTLAAFPDLRVEITMACDTTGGDYLALHDPVMIFPPPPPGYEYSPPVPVVQPVEPKPGEQIREEDIDSARQALGLVEAEPTPDEPTEPVTVSLAGAELRRLRDFLNTLPPKFFEKKIEGWSFPGNGSFLDGPATPASFPGPESFTAGG